MKLTPLDIRKQEFDRSLRGYSADEVEAFLDMMATQWEEMTNERRRLEKRVEELEGQIEHYRKVEDALQEALTQLRENAEEKLENARQEAKIIVQEAETEAEKIKQQAKSERDQLKSEARYLHSRRGEVVARLRGFLHSELEILEHFEDQDRPTAPPPEGTDLEEESPLSEGLEEHSASQAGGLELEDVESGAGEGTEASAERRPEADEGSSHAGDTEQKREGDGTEVQAAPPRGSRSQEGEDQIVEDEGASESPDVFPSEGETPAGPSGPQPASSDLDREGEEPPQEPSPEAEQETTVSDSESRAEETKQKRSSQDDKEEPSSKEIEKIWNILEDMEQE